jgi:hypothetical protein
MELTVKFDADGSLVTLLATGDVVREGFRGKVEAVLSHPAWHPGMPTLCDFRKLNIYKLSAEDIKRLVEVHRGYAELTKETPSPIAVVVAKKFDCGLIRMWEFYANDMFPMYNVFLQMEDALNWLRECDQKNAKGRE